MGRKIIREMLLLDDLRNWQIHVVIPVFYSFMVKDFPFLFKAHEIAMDTNMPPQARDMFPGTVSRRSASGRNVRKSVCSKKSTYSVVNIRFIS